MVTKRVYGGRWAAASRGYLQQHPLCVMCEQQGIRSAASVVDHIIPHRLKAALKSNDPVAIKAAQRLFWDKKNWQSLCNPHHSSTKQRMEKRGAEIGCDVNGIPLDPNSHWRK